MVSYAMISRPGNRTQNEDYIQMYERQGSYVFALADALGGHGRGAMASQSVVNQAIQVFRDEPDEFRYLDHAFREAQERLMQQKRALGCQREMKTTMVLLQINRQFVQWGHIGDSRLYYFKKGKMVTRTLDHSVPQMLALNGMIRESEIRGHEDRNRVLRVLGAPLENASYELSERILPEGTQAFLLCTDGFWELIGEKEMEQTLRESRNAAQWLRSMEEIVLKNGRGVEMDNYSAICVCSL